MNWYKMSERQFPIIRESFQTDRKYRHLFVDFFNFIPWSIVAPHEKQAMTNHSGQDLEHLASRGGLGMMELCAVLQDKKYRDVYPYGSCDTDEKHLKAILDAFKCVKSFIK